MSKVDELRKKYMDNPPIGYSRKDVSKMSDDELLDMDYFLNEDLDCEKCHTGTMYPVNYKSPRGIVYKFDD